MPAFPRRCTLHERRARVRAAPHLGSHPMAERDRDDFAQQLRGFGPVGLLGLVIVLAGNFLVAPLSAVLVLVWARLSGTPWRALGFVAPRSWTRVVAIGIPLGVA